MSSQPSPKIHIDPSAPGTIIRRAFALEALLNTLTLPLLLSPRPILSLLVQNPETLTPTTDLLGQSFAALVLGALTPALLLGLPNTRQAIESRRVVYLVLGGGEAVLIPVLVAHALGVAGVEGAFGVLATWGAVGCLVPPVLWRAYALFVRPELFGRYKGVGEGKGE